MNERMNKKLILDWGIEKRSKVTVGGGGTLYKNNFGRLWGQLPLSETKYQHKYKYIYKSRNQRSEPRGVGGGGGGCSHPQHSSQ